MPHTPSRLAALALGVVLAAPAHAAPVTAITRSTTPPGLADGFSDEVLWDAAGRFAVFRSDAPDLVAGQSTPPNVVNAFVFDRFTGAVRLVSHLPGAPTVGASEDVDAALISADGEWVTFMSAATDLVAEQVDTNDSVDVFLWRRATGTTVLVSHASGAPATAANGDSTIEARDAVSADGRYVVFTSDADDLTFATNLAGFRSVYLFDRLADPAPVRFVSHSAILVGASANAPSHRPSISHDGRWVAFDSDATNLVAGLTDANGVTDVFLWDTTALEDPATRLVSRQAGFATTTGDDASHSARVSADGTAVAFFSQASDLEGSTSDTNAAFDVFHYDRPGDVLTLVSHKRFTPTTTSAVGVTATISPLSISADGDHVAFLSAATDLVGGQSDVNTIADVFLWSGGAHTLVSHAAGSTTTAGNGSLFGPLVSPDGDEVVFTSFATNLVPGQVDGNNGFDVFSWRRGPETVSLLSHVPGSELQVGDDTSFATSVTADGLVGFVSVASDLVPDSDVSAAHAFFHGGAEVFADGFESGDVAAWSAAAP